MKALFLLLLLANLGLYAYSQGYLTPAPDNAELAQRSPLNADRIRLLSAAQVSAMPKIKIVPKMSACLEWGSLTLVEAARAEKAVASLALGDRLSQRRVDDPRNDGRIESDARHGLAA